jgi:hypothetical protein
MRLFERVRKFVSIVTLLMWMGCYLNCFSERLRGDCGCVNPSCSTHCPCSNSGDIPCDDEGCCDSEFALPSDDSELSTEAPISDLGMDQYSALYSIILVTAGCFQASVDELPHSSLRDEFCLREMDCARPGSPIRGPSV